MGIIARNAGFGPRGTRGTVRALSQKLPIAATGSPHNRTLLGASFGAPDFSSVLCGHSEISPREVGATFGEIHLPSTFWF